MTRSHWILAAMAGSAGLLLGAFAFQYLGGMAPCKLCLWQRWPHGAAVLIGALALVWPLRGLPVLGALSALATASIGVYHTGVEQKWWQGPTTCTSGSIDGVSAEQLLNQILAAPIVRCDEIAWQMLGLSMASWNVLLSLVLVAFWIRAASLRA